MTIALPAGWKTAAQKYLHRTCCVSMLLVITVLHLSSTVVQADPPVAGGMFDSAAVYGGQGVDHNLRELPGKIITGRVNWDKSYLFALGLGKVQGTLGQSYESLQHTPFASISQGYEMVLVKHHGLQHNAEVGGAYQLRTPDLYVGPLGMNFSAGAGLSYALGTPTYEDGPMDDPERRYRLQFLGLFEFEWRTRWFKNISLITRIHHRSGVYGLIAPRNVGSNFLTTGVRFAF